MPDDVVVSVVVVVLDGMLFEGALVSGDGTVLFTGWLELALVGADVVVSGVDWA